MKPKIDNPEWIESRLSLPPVDLRVIAWEGEQQRTVRPDVVIEAAWADRRVRFLAEIKGRSIPKMLQEAAAQAQAAASPPETYPMVIVPYLSPDKLLKLEADGVSGVDLCGNGVLAVPGQMLVFRSGKPNQFRESVKLRNAYRGMNSLVARAFLIQPWFSRVKDIASLLDERGEGVALSTVSKALKGLEDDLVISRAGNRIRLVQPETLLDKLAANYDPPRAEARFRAKCSLPAEQMRRRLATAASKREVKVVLTGAASAEEYAVAAPEPAISIYSAVSPSELLDRSEIEVSETSRFANLEIIQTDDARVFLDARSKNGIPFASPVQTYLELATGDKRQKDAAEQVRRGILDSLQRTGEGARP